MLLSTSVSPIAVGPALHGCDGIVVEEGFAGLAPDGACAIASEARPTKAAASVAVRMNDMAIPPDVA
jgi:hypothetical protein